MVDKPLVKSVIGEVVAKSPVLFGRDFDLDTLVGLVLDLSQEHISNNPRLHLPLNRSKLKQITKFAMTEMGIPCVDVDFSLATELGEFEPIQDRAKHYLPFVADKLDLSEKYRLKVLELIDKVDSPTRSPKTLLSAMIYITGLLLDSRNSQFEVSRLCGVSEVSLRNAYQGYVDELGLAVVKP